MDSARNAYVTGSTISSLNFPTTAGAFQSAFGGGSSDAFVTKIVEGAPPTDFLLSATPSSQTVSAGASTSYTVNIGRTGGFAGAVTFIAAGLPAGATASFSPNPASGNSSTLTVTATTTPTGSFTVTITGVSGSLTHITSVTLVVGDFSLSATPSSQTVSAGASTSYTVNISRTGAGDVTFSAAGLPAGATASFSPNPASGNSSTLTVTTATTTTPTASFTVTITGVIGNLTHTTSVTLVVTTVADFSLSATPSSQTVSAGASTSYTVNISRTGGFAGAVTFSAAGLPVGAATTFSPNPASGNSSTVTVSTARGLLPPWPKLRLPPATFSVRGWPLWAIGLLVLVLLAHRAKTRRQAAVWIFAATVFVVLLVLACGGGSPRGGTPAGTSTLTITGTSGSLTRTTTVTLTVN